MTNVRFYRLDALPAYEAAKHQGVFVHLTVTENGHQTGLWFGGSQGWEYLTNDPNAVKIDEKSLKRATSEDASAYGIEEGSIYVKDDFIDNTFKVTKTVGYLKQNETIDKGTTIEELLKKILVKVLLPKISTNPSSTLNIGSGAGVTVFVGSNITFPGANISTSNGSYQSYDDAEQTDFSEMVSQPSTGVFFNHETITTTTNCNYNINTGSVNEGSNDSTTPITSGSVKIEPQTVKAILGENKVTYNATSHHTASTNTGLKSDNTAASLSIAAGDKTPANSGSSRINTGVLPLYVNFKGELKQAGNQSNGTDAANTWFATADVAETNTNPTQVTNVYNSTVIRISTGPTNPTHQLTVWFPSGTVSSVMTWNTLSGKFDAPIECKMLDDIEIEFAGEKYKYHVVQIDRTDSPGAGDYKFTFSDNQSTNK
jgi:hypothetical protein